MWSALRSPLIITELTRAHLELSRQMPYPLSSHDTNLATVSATFQIIRSWCLRNSLTAKARNIELVMFTRNNR